MKKKSLIVYTFSDWKELFNKGYGRVSIPKMYAKPKKRLWEHDIVNTKIKVTIEEL